MTSILRLQGVRKRFGGIRAVDGVSFGLDEGGLVGLIGPNGSGKSTLFNVISGVYPPDAGEIRFQGERIDGLEPSEIFDQGIVRCFQNPRLFLGMTVMENALVPPREQIGESVLHAPFPSRWRDQEVALAHESLEALELHGLTEVRGNWATDISGGQMKLLEVCRAMMGEPRLLLLDEPTAGVAPKLATDIFDAIRRLQKEAGLTFFIIEHRLDVLFDYVERVLVMNRGQIIFDGDPEAAVEAPQVLESYLGE